MFKHLKITFLVTLLTCLLLSLSQYLLRAYHALSSEAAVALGVGLMFAVIIKVLDWEDHQSVSSKPRRPH